MARLSAEERGEGGMLPGLLSTALLKGEMNSTTPLTPRP